MNNRFKLPFVFRWINVQTNQSGAAALTVFLVVMAVALIVVSTTTFIGLDNLNTGFSQQVSSSLVLSAESCAEEAILRLSRDQNYSGGLLSVGDTQCAIAVTGVPCGDCVIDVVAQQDAFTRKIQSDVSVVGSTMSVSTWKEIE